MVKVYIKGLPNNCQIIIKCSKESIIKFSSGIPAIKNINKKNSRFTFSTLGIKAGLACTSFESVIIFVDGIGKSRFIAFKSLVQLLGSKVSKVFFVSRQSFNGCRIKRPRRL